MSELAATVSAAPRAAALSGRGGLEFLGTLKSITAQPAVARSLPALMMLGVVGAGALLWAAVSEPPARDLFASLPDDEKAAVAEALSGAGIDYEVDRSTGAIAVTEDNYHQARMLLAAQGLPKSAPDGDALISGLPLGASRAVEGERLRAAKELDLARTIEAIDAVQSARVHLAVDTPSVFLRDRSRRAASVMLRLAPGRALGEGQVQAIVHLVASSVPGMAPDGVSVVDQSGRLLSSGDGDGGAAGSDRQVAVQSKIEQRYLQALTSLLTPIVGHGNFTAEVHADVDFSEVQATREGFPQEASTVAREERTWSGSAPAEEAGGIPGAMSNQAPPAATVAAAPGGTLDPKTPGAEDEGGEAAATGSGNYKRNYAIGREVSVTKKPTGEVKRLTVAVALRNPEGGKPLGKKELSNIEALVKGAVGFNGARGDVVALNALSFAPVEEPAPIWKEPESIAGFVRSIGGVLLALVVVVVGFLTLRRKGLLGAGAGMGGLAGVAGASRGTAPDAEAAKIAATMEKELAAAFAQRQRPDPADLTLNMIEAAPSYEARAVLIRNFVRENPARAALVIRDLLRNGKPEGATKVG